MRRLTLITTGGTIEKTYDEQTGALNNRRSIVRRMLRRLRLEETSVSIIELMSKDSLVMTDEDRRRIAEVVGAVLGTTNQQSSKAAKQQSGGSQGGEGAGVNSGGGSVSPSEHNAEDVQGVVILHGTDTLNLTGEKLCELFPTPPVPIVLTGAMRPFEMKTSDALQNLTEAVFAAGTLPPGIYCVAHGRALKFPGVKKDRDRGTFVKQSKPEREHEHEKARISQS
jgi:L-asparaginase